MARKKEDIKKSGQKKISTSKTHKQDRPWFGRAASIQEKNEKKCIWICKLDLICYIKKFHFITKPMKTIMF